MPKEEWGVKRVCPNCATRFYDLQRDPMTCPGCGHSFTADSLTSGKGRPLVSDKPTPAKKTAPVKDLTADEDVIDDEDSPEVELADDVLDDEDDNVSFDDLADVASDDDEN